MGTRDKAVTNQRAPLVVLLVLCVGGFTYLFGPVDPVPRLHASAESPDGEVTVKVYRKRVSLRPPEVVVLARVYDRRGGLLLEKRVFSDGGWYDAEWMFRRITFEGGEIRIGPKYAPGEYVAIRAEEYTVAR
ncbi:MAG: hypothetical protein ABW208_25980 [Pyrinomonadaceae bacterium]